MVAGLVFSLLPLAQLEFALCMIRCNESDFNEWTMMFLLYLELSTIKIFLETRVDVAIVPKSTHVQILIGHHGCTPVISIIVIVRAISKSSHFVDEWKDAMRAL